MREQAKCMNQASARPRIQGLMTNFKDYIKRGRSPDDISQTLFFCYGSRGPAVAGLKWVGVLLALKSMLWLNSIASWKDKTYNSESN